MEVKYALSREDYWQFNKFLMKRMRRCYRTHAACGVSASISCLALGRLTDMPRSLVLGLAVAAGGVGVALGFLLIKYQVARYVRRLPAEDGSTLRECTLKIQPEGIEANSSLGGGALRWGGFREVTESQDYVYLFTDKHVSLIASKRAVANSADATIFADAARTYFQSSRRPLQS